MAAYPVSVPFNSVTRSLEFETRIVVGENGVEQRWPITSGEQRWVLTYNRLTLAQRDTILTAFDDAKGSFDHTLTFAFLGTTYSDIHFEEDKISPVEQAPGKWALTVALRQYKRAADTGTMPTEFPTLSTGARVQLPFTHEHEFLNVTCSTEGGRHRWNRKAAAIRRWSAGGTVLSDAEADAIWELFSLAGGRWKMFGFTDPDNDTWYDSRFAEDKIERKYVSPGVNAVEVLIQQVQ